MKAFYQKGITALEIIIIIAIVGIILAVALPQFARIKENQVLKTAVGDIVSSIDKARSQTLSSLDSAQYGVHLEPDSVIIFKGTAYSAVAPENEIISIVSPASISNINLSLGGSDVYFNRLSGTPSKTGTITVSSTNYTKIITIGATGFATSN